MLHPHLLTFLQRQPDVDVQLIVDDRDIDPIREGVDLAIRITDAPPAGLAARPLMSVDQVLCATPAYLARRAPIAHPQDLLAHSCLFLGEHERDNHWRLRRGDEAETVVVRGRYVVNHSEIRLEGVLAELGVGCLPIFIARRHLADGTIVRVLKDWQFETKYRGQAWILYPPSRFAVPKFRVLIDHLVDALAST